MIEIQTEQDLLLLRESEEVEFKEAAGRDRQGELPNNFWETYSAMANTDGGYVFLGIAERNGLFRFAGLSSTERLRKQLVDIANNRNKTSVNLFSNDSFQDLNFRGNHILCVRIPRAKRQQRPVYLNNNPIGNSYRRVHEADQRLTDEEVKRYLAEQLGDSRDAEMLPGFGLQDISRDTFRAYRQLYANLQPEHPWNESDDQLFLEQIGGGRRNRETNAFSLTVAGLLMFGTHPVIQEKFPYYMLDYQERSQSNTQARWIDRVTLDGSWSGNLFDFHRRVYLKLVAGLKTPFHLEGDKRVDETPVHVALREALVNTLVHADYSDRASVLVVKRPDMFGFRNPGLMRVSWEVAMSGGESDCRNRLLHQMFRYVGLGEQAGSGIPKILDGWKKTHWRPPSLYEKTETYNQTLLELRMIDLFPAETVSVLRRMFDGKAGRIDYQQLDHNAQVALALAFSEGMVGHERLKQLTGDHSTDLSRTLHQLVDRKVLRKTGNSRSAVYHLIGLAAPLDPNDVFGSEPDTTQTDSDTTHLNDYTTQKEAHTTRSGPKSAKRDQNGCIIHKRLNYPVIDKVDKISYELREKLEQIAAPVRNSKRINEGVAKKTIMELCRDRYVTISALAALLGRTEKTLRNSYLSRMVKDKQLSLAFPKSPRDTRQAYIAAALQDETEASET